MEIVYRKLSSLKPNPKNPRKATEGAIKELANSIKGNPKFFEARPILLSDRTGELVIIAGERRSEAAKWFPKRKAMNSFICDTERRFTFVGTINEDVNTYTSGGRRGEVFLTVPFVCLHQLQTQKNKGGMTDLYKDSGTYVKSFYTVMYTPSAVKVAVMGGDAEKRLHHQVDWNRCAVKILPARYRKK